MSAAILLTKTIHHKAALLLGLFDPEFSHNVALWLLSKGIVPKFKLNEISPEFTDIELMGLVFRHPVGLAAGFDKDARALSGLFKLGFSFIEVGTVTPLAQSGNASPRLFRLKEDRALINRMGFNSKGLEYFCKQLESWRKNSASKGQIVGVNIGANRNTENKIIDYVKGFNRVADISDYITINISSPNTPGLRSMQEGSELSHLLDALIKTQSSRTCSPPVLLKVSPDLSFESLEHLIKVSSSAGITGLILTNTTSKRPKNLVSHNNIRDGGLSGAPLSTLAAESLRAARSIAPEGFVLVAAGGISNRNIARQRFNDGASLLQLYTEFIYQGAGVIDELLAAADI